MKQSEQEEYLPRQSVAHLYSALQVIPWVRKNFSSRKKLDKTETYSSSQSAADTFIS